MKALALTLFVAATILPAQQHTTPPERATAPQRATTPRSDGHTTPLMVYRPANRKSFQSSSCPPLAVISHGAGGSENGYRYLAEEMASLGYTAVVMGHAESGFDALRANMRAQGIRPGVRALVADPEAEKDRLLDVDATLRWADSQCPAPGKIPFRVLLGHSMGSETVMLEAGATNTIGIPTPPAAQNRFDAYIALSPQGPGVVFSDHAWTHIRKPVLILTGTRDQAVNGGPESRQIPFRELPGSPNHCQWLGVIDNATHMNFAGAGFGADPVKSAVDQTIAAFLAGVRRGSCPLPSPTSSLHLGSK
jgi:predicted dienelactone hydrolase